MITGTNTTMITTMNTGTNTGTRMGTGITAICTSGRGPQVSRWRG